MQGDLYFGIKFQVKTLTVLKLRFKIYLIRIFFGSDSAILSRTTNNTVQSMINRNEENKTSTNWMVIG